MYSPREREQRRIVDQRCEKLGHGLGVLEREVDKCRRRLFYDLQASWEKEVQRQKNERWRRAAVVIIENYVRKWLVRRAYLKFLSVTTSIQEATKVAINPIQDSRANLLEEGGNDTVQPCDTTQVRSDSDLLPFDLWTSYLVRILFLQDVAAGYGNFLVPQGSLMSCNIISKCGTNSLMFQNPFLIRIPYSS